MRLTWREGYVYSMAGVITTDLVPIEASQRALIGALDRERSGALMAALDACNARWGRGAVVPAAVGLPDRRGRSMRFEMRSPRFTTRLDVSPSASAGT